VININITSLRPRSSVVRGVPSTRRRRTGGVGYNIDTVALQDILACNSSVHAFFYSFSHGVYLPSVAGALVCLPVGEEVSVVSIGVCRGSNSEAAQESSGTGGAGDAGLDIYVRVIMRTWE
jgi:hypothetical protein